MWRKENKCDPSTRKIIEKDSRFSPRDTYKRDIYKGCDGGTSVEQITLVADMGPNGDVTQQVATDLSATKDAAMNEWAPSLVGILKSRFPGFQLKWPPSYHCLWDKVPMHFGTLHYMLTAQRFVIHFLKCTHKCMHAVSNAARLPTPPVHPHQSC